LKNFVVYKSSAGSGKTFTLVKEYLKLSLIDKSKLTYNFKRILAITFTNLAAAEMKDRIISSLQQITENKKTTDIAKILAQELNVSQEELIYRSKIVLENILHNYSDLAVGTIDSFTHKLIKTFAFDLRLPINFNLELDPNEFYNTVIDELISKIGDDEYVSNLLKEFTLNQVDVGGSWDPEKNLKEFTKLLTKEDSENYFKKLNEYNETQLLNIKQKINADTKLFINSINSIATKALIVLSKYELELGDFKYNGAGNVSVFQNIIKTRYNFIKDKWVRFEDAIVDEDWLKSSASISASDAKKVAEELSQIGTELLLYINDNYKTYRLNELLSKQIYSLLLLKKIQDIATQTKQEEQIVFLSEFNKTIFNLINNEPTPFIYERIGEKYHHYLIDEFQDTSNLQFQNLIPLLDNTLSNGFYNLIVGDGKQSIYRWRNADVKQFETLPNILIENKNKITQQREDNLIRNYSKKILDTNYRSTSTVVNFNNTFFRHIAENFIHDEDRNIYDDLEQKLNVKNEGLVTIRNDVLEGLTLDEHNTHLVHEYINNALSKNFKYSDICVIVRKKSDGHTVANYLKSKNIPIISNESILLKNSIEVNTIISFLNYLSNNNDQISAVAVINYLYQKQQINFNLYCELLLKSNNSSLFELLNLTGINLNENDFLFQNIFDNCLTIIKALNLNSHGYNYVRFFLDEVLDFLINNNSNLNEFLYWWENRKNSASIIISSDANAVKIMTIHASKGLEFSVVIIPYCNWKLFREEYKWVNISNSNITLPTAVIKINNQVNDAGFEIEYNEEESNQLLDHANMLYVAFTRAIQNLHIICSTNKKSPKNSVQAWLKSFIEENKIQKNEKNEFAFGIDKIAEIKEKSKPLVYNISQLKFENILDVVKIKSSNSNKELGDAKEYGIIFHNILGKIKTLNDVENVLTKSLLIGEINVEDIERLKEQINILFNHPVLFNYFSDNYISKIEQELITKDGLVLRPDRVFSNASETIVLDYKTGQRNDALYLSKMTKYKNALIDLGYINVKIMLYYIELNELVEL